MAARFVSEPIFPEAETCDTARMAAGAPGLPRRFTWRGDAVEVAEVLRTWKQDGRCRNGSTDRYVRKHWYEVRTRTGAIMTLYFERSFRSRPSHAERWWLFSVDGGAEAPRAP